MAHIPPRSERPTRAASLPRSTTAGSRADGSLWALGGALAMSHERLRPPKYKTRSRLGTGSMILSGSKIDHVANVPGPVQPAFQRGSSKPRRKESAMDDPVLDLVLEQLSERDLSRARASSERAGDHDLVAKIEQRLRDCRLAPRSPR